MIGKPKKRKSESDFPNSLFTLPTRELALDYEVHAHLQVGNTEPDLSI
jgi:hypothetical protein